MSTDTDASDRAGGAEQCPACGETTGVLETRARPNHQTRRRRECEACGYRYRTIEVRVPDGFDLERVEAFVAPVRAVSALRASMQLLLATFDTARTEIRTVSGEPDGSGRNPAAPEA